MASPSTSEYAWSVPALSQPILIVEDDPGMRAALAALLNSSQRTTVTARNAEEALAHLRSGQDVPDHSRPRFARDQRRGLPGGAPR